MCLLAILKAYFVSFLKRQLELEINDLLGGIGLNWDYSVGVNEIISLQC